MFDISPVYPYSGIVVNLNVSTIPHRDKKDFNLCLVLQISKCTGGALVFKEPGVVVELNNGDFTIFDSVQITHFNLHYKGLRASFVLHSDADGRYWAQDRNQWEESVFLNSAPS